MNPYPRITPTADLADQPGPEAVDRRSGWKQSVVDLCRVATRTVRRDGESVRREIGEGVGHVGMILQPLAQYSSHYLPDILPKADARMLERYRSIQTVIDPC